VTVAAIVLAGGASSRFGGDKLAAPLDGRPILEHAVLAVASIADPVIVVIGPDDPIPLIPADLGVSLLLARDPVARQGPLAGMAAGLVALVAAHGSGAEGPGAAPGSRARAEVVLVVGGDMPSLVPEVLRLLATFLIADPSLAAATLETPGVAPLPLALRPDIAGPAIGAILASGGRRSIRALLGAVPSATVPASAWRAIDPAGITLRDVDKPADLEGG
jgi:molybdopterin-guanine dinucleotide biosynthesis protein A